jgi:hypothetical protein
MAATQVQTVAREYTPAPALGEWGIGAVLTLLLSALFMAAEPSAAIGIASLFLLCGWIIWAWRYPRWALACLFLAWITIYNRATLPLFQVEGGLNRGGLSLGDLLWVGFTLAWLAQRNAFKETLSFIIDKRYNPLLFLVLTYIAISFSLPFLGVWIFGWSPSYAIPGVRHLQWSSFALFSIWLMRQYGVLSTWRLMLTVLTIASVLHASYALIQYLATFGTISIEWLFLDKVVTERFESTYFFYPRTTGLLTNPNNLGLFGASVLSILLASYLARAPIGSVSALLMSLSAGWVLATSASRTALVGVLITLGALSVIAVLQTTLRSDGNSMHYRVGCLIRLLLILSVATVFLWFLTPEHSRERIILLIDVAIRGASEDPNAIGRLNAWERALRSYEEQFPLGTWVPAGYALDTFVDSYYVCLIVQGTPVYMGLFICLLIAVLSRAWEAGLANDTSVAGAGLALLGMTILVGIASTTLIPLENAHVIPLFWFLLGVGVGTIGYRGERSA